MHASPLEKVLRYFFGWNFAAVPIALLVGAAVSVAAINQFYLGYALFIFAGLWAIGHWLFSDFLSEKRRKLKSRAYRTYRRRLDPKRERIFLNLWVYLGSFAIVLIFCIPLWWTHKTRHDYMLDDVSAHLSIEAKLPNKGDAIKSIFTVTNGSSFALSSVHDFSCEIRFSRFDNGTTINGISMHQSPGAGWINGSMDGMVMSKGSVIAPHGDSQTDSCLTVLPISSPTVCTDVTIGFFYYLEDVPDELQNKFIRFVYDRDSGNGWVKQPIASKQKYCS